VELGNFQVFKGVADASGSGIRFTWPMEQYKGTLPEDFETEICQKEKNDDRVRTTLFRCSNLVQIKSK